MMSDDGFQSQDKTLVRPATLAPVSPTDQTLASNAKGSAPQVSRDGPLPLTELVEQLPLDEREAITLYFFEKWSLDRVAAAMNRTPEQVAALLLSASKSLKSRLVPT